MACSSWMQGKLQTHPGIDMSATERYKLWSTAVTSGCSLRCGPQLVGDFLWWTPGISYRSNRLSTDDGQSDEKAKASLQLRNKLLMFDGKAHNYFLNNARRIWRQISQNVFVPDDRGFDHSLIVWECEVIDLPVAFLTFRAKHKVSAYQRPTCEDLSSAGLIAHTHVLQLTRKNKTKQGCERTCRPE